MVLDSLFNKLNQKYGTVNKKQLAVKMMKQSSTEVGKAVVNLLGATGIAGFKFHIPETESVKFENEITDHYIDTNSAVQDHIAQKPVTITLTGLVGDYFYSVNQLEDLLALVTPTMTLVKEFLPEIRDAMAALKIKHKAAVDISEGYTYDPETNKYTPGAIAANVKTFNVMDLFTLFQGLYKLKSAQTRAFIFFECMWKSRALFSVETTWKRFDNMVIQSLEPKRDRNADITEFTITFKQISLTETKTETLEEYKNRYEQQNTEIVNKGAEKGEEISITDVDTTYA